MCIGIACLQETFKSADEWEKIVNAGESDEYSTDGLEVDGVDIYKLLINENEPDAKVKNNDVIMRLFRDIKEFCESI